ncbi:hypothetical protein PG990_001915 [Apiospora arundinis]|uniref:Uncharacterized protein n=1 Tax=Apiospora arundinis TaxID=335852 RepID=A0ABR2I3E1_9PEZI
MSMTALKESKTLPDTASIDAVYFIRYRDISSCAPTFTDCSSGIMTTTITVIKHTTTPYPPSTL